MNNKALSLNVPMLLTWARIALIPIIIGVFYIPDWILSPFMQNVWATVIFVIAALTDAFENTTWKVRLVLS